MKQINALNKLFELKENFSVKIILGLRGIGKRTLLKTFAENLRAENEKIIFIDCKKIPALKNFQQLYEFVDVKTDGLERFFLIINEIDLVAQWEKALNALFVSTPAEIYVTGSSESLAEKIVSLLPENCDVLKLSPLSFSEFDDLTEQEEFLESYLHFGAMPDTFNVDKNYLPKILHGLLYEILFDIAEKNSLSDIGLLRTLTKFLAQNLGKPVNVNEYLRSLGENNSRKVRNYLRIVLDSGLFRKIPRLDIKANSFMMGGEKFYCIDNGLLCALAEVEENALIENSVCNELLRRGFEVSAGKFGAMNINFVATKGEEKVFIQVLPPDDSITARRITRPLRALPEDVEKILISLKPIKTLGDVKTMTLRQFLLSP